MAQRRMISKSIAEDDRFIDMKPISKLLYFYLVLNADDDGFVGSVKMINFLTGAKKDNYDELLNNNLILQPTNNGVYVITDWYTQNKIDPKIYKPTTYLSIRALLYIKSDFAYTTNPRENEVMAPADLWIKNGRDKKTSPEIQSQRYAQRIQELSKNVPRNIQETSEKVLAQNRLDKTRVDKTRVEQIRESQQRAEKGNKDKYLNATTSSNGGMGEISSSSTSTSSLDNNATSESGENSSVNSEVNYLLDYANSLFPNGVPNDNERLNVQLTDLLNQYRPEFIKQALDNLAKQVGNNYPSQQIPTLLVGHLADTVKQVTVNQ